MRLWGGLMVHDRFDQPARQYAVGAAFLRSAGTGAVKTVRGWDAARHDLRELITDARIPHAGTAKSLSYEGEGYVIVRHPRTEVVEQALQRIVDTVRVEMTG